MSWAFEIAKQVLVSLIAGLILLAIQSVIQFGFGFGFERGNNERVIQLDGFVGRLFYLVAVATSAYVTFRTWAWGLSEVKYLSFWDMSGRMQLLGIMFGAPLLTFASFAFVYSGTNWLFFGDWVPLPKPNVE